MASLNFSIHNFLSCIFKASKWIDFCSVLFNNSIPNSTFSSFKSRLFLRSNSRISKIEIFKLHTARNKIENWTKLKNRQIWKLDKIEKSTKLKIGQKMEKSTKLTKWKNWQTGKLDKKLKNWTKNWKIDKIENGQKLKNRQNWKLDKIEKSTKLQIGQKIEKLTKLKIGQKIEKSTKLKIGQNWKLDKIENWTKLKR